MDSKVLAFIVTKNIRFIYIVIFFAFELIASCPMDLPAKRRTGLFRKSNPQSKPFHQTVSVHFCFNFVHDLIYFLNDFFTSATLTRSHIQEDLLSIRLPNILRKISFPFLHLPHLRLHGLAPVSTSRKWGPIPPRTLHAHNPVSVESFQRDLSCSNHPAVPSRIDLSVVKYR